MIEGLTTRTQTEGDGSTVIFPFSDELQDAEDLTVVYRDVNGVETTLVNPTDYTLVLTDNGSSGGTITLVSIIPLADEFMSMIVKGAIPQTLDLTTSGGFSSADLENAIDRVALGVRYSTVDQEGRTIKLTDGAVQSEDHPFDALSNRIANVADPTADQDAATRGSVTVQINAAASNLNSVGTVTVSPFMETVLDDADGDESLTTQGITAYMLDIVKAANLAGSVSAQGMSAVVQAILQDNTAGDILTELNFSAYIQTLIDAADAETARATLEIDASVAHNNELCNGDFQIWQQGIQFTAAIPAAGGNDDDSYFADQWILLSDGNDVVDIDKVVGTTVRAKQACEFEIATADTGWGFLQILDADTSQSLRDFKVSLSMEIEAPGDATLFEMHLIEWTGTADSPTTDPILAWNALTTTPSLDTVSGWDFVAGSTTSISATATSTTFKVEDITVPSGVNNLAVLVTTLDGAMGATSVVRFSEINLVRGSLAGVFRSIAKPDALAKCEQWYTKSFELETFPAENLTFTGAIHAWTHDEGNTAGAAAHTWNFPQRMIQTPTMVTYNPSAANANWRNTTDANTLTAIVVGTSTRSTLIYANASGNTNDVWAIHATADARF